MELDNPVVRVALYRASNEVAEPKPLAAFRAKLWLVVPGDRRKLEIYFLPAESITLPEKSYELSHVNWDLLTRWRRR